jgi:outer membrane immunogenic protein
MVRHLNHSLVRGFNMKKFLLAAVLLGAATGFAQAADPIMDPPVIEAPAFDWTGFYLGINGGVASGSSPFNFPFYPSGVTVPLSGWNLSVVAGGAWQSGMFVLGAEGEIGWTNVGGATPCPNPAFTCAISSNWIGDVELQAGLAVDSALFYLHGGLAALNTTGTTAPFVPGTATAVATGYVVGAGLKIAVTENVSLTGEYSYYNVSATFPAGQLDPASAVNINPSFHRFTVGANLHF